MSVDLVTIAVTRAPDLHPPGASKTSRPANEPPADTNTTETSLFCIHSHYQQNGIPFLNSYCTVSVPAHTKNIICIPCNGKWYLCNDAQKLTVPKNAYFEN
jgi:hypothetical protein